MIRLALFALLLSGCYSFAGIGVAPNGMVWVATNTAGGFGGPQAGAIYGCTPRGAELFCSRVTPHGLP